ncbi:PorT family protein [Chitinophagaceae bacterium LB-8]|uniref:PorT family protein n=1 Tax=Paraflavisolibacter caeni TaxID=2982496 RepID=A0A9X3BAA2_9BACT|nr:porin family protein [Paraflavisolibacter caeni]MCU7552426.1 PorT family protein [Paraflavisolibacter caeni]
MNKKLCVLLGAVLLANIAMAQFTLGVKAGANLTKIDGKSFKDEFETGYHLGGFAEIGLGGKLGIQPEVLFNQYQTRVDTSFGDVYSHPFSQKAKLNYLSIPLLLSYKLGSSLSLIAGPQFGVLIDKDKSLVKNGEDAISNGDFSVLGGAQLKISKFRLSGRYFVGLNDIKDIDQVGDQSKWKNQGWQLSVGLAL